MKKTLFSAFMAFISVYAYAQTVKEPIVIIPFEYDRCYNYSDGLIHVEKFDEEGIDKCHEYLDIQGNVVISLGKKYLECGDFSEGLAWVVGEEDKIGYINKKGEEVIPCQYEYPQDYAPQSFKEGLAALWQGDYLGYIDKDGNEVIPAQYEVPKWADCVDFSEGLVCVSDGESSFYIDKEGNKVIPATLKGGSSFKNGVAEIYGEGGDNYFVDKTGKKVTRPENWDVNEEGLEERVNDDYLAGFVNLKGELVIPYRYDPTAALYHFHNGYCSVRDPETKKWGVIKNPLKDQEKPTASNEGKKDKVKKALSVFKSILETLQ